MNLKASFIPVWRTSEGRLLAFSLVLITATVAALAVLFEFEVKLAETILACIGFNLIGGRAPGVGIFIIEGYKPALAIAVSIYLEFLIVIFCYSVFVLTLNNFIRIAWLQRVIKAAGAVAHQNEDKIRAYGWWGLLIFVMVPLPLTGPLMGSYIGYFLRFSFARNFSAVTLGTALAVTTWAYFFEFLDKYLHIFQYVFAGLLLVLLALFLPRIIRLLKHLGRAARGT